MRTVGGAKHASRVCLSLPETRPQTDHVLDLARDRYAAFVLGNAKALAAGDKAFVIDTYGEEVSYLARPYPERSRRMVQARIRDQLDAAEREQTLRWLEARGLVDQPRSMRG